MSVRDISGPGHPPSPQARGAGGRGRAAGGGAPGRRLGATLLALLVSFAAPALLGAQEAVQILSGTQGPAAAPGIRVIARVQFNPHRTRYEAVRPLWETEVLAVQRALGHEGIDPGPHDGLMGPKVRAALTTFQRRLGGDPCGCLDGPTIEALGLRARVIQTVVGADGDVPAVEVIRPPARTPPPPPPPPADRPAVDPPGPELAGPPPYAEILWPVPILRPGLGGPGLGPSPPVMRSGGRLLGPPGGRLARGGTRGSPPPPRSPSR